MTGDGVHWAVVNASPDLRQQIIQTSSLHPRSGPRDTPISAIVLTSAEIDHVAGLLTLRERQAFALWASESVLDELAANPIFNALSPDKVIRRALPEGEPVQLLPGLVMESFTLPGKIPLYREASPGEADAFTEGMAAGAAALKFTSEGASPLVYAPGCAMIEEAFLSRLDQSTTLLFDGTVFHDDEMIREGVGEKTGRRMGHAPMAGAGGSLEMLRSAPLARRIYIHINNTNPVLIEGSPEERAVRAAGWEIGYDGMEISL